MKFLPELDIFLIAWKSTFQAAKWRDSGRDGWLLKQTPELRREKEARRGAGQVSAFHLDIQDDTSGARETALSNRRWEALQSREG